MCVRVIVGPDRLSLFRVALTATAVVTATTTTVAVAVTTTTAVVAVTIMTAVVAATTTTAVVAVVAATTTTAAVAVTTTTAVVAATTTTAAVGRSVRSRTSARPRACSGVPAQVVLVSPPPPPPPPHGPHTHAHLTHAWFRPPTQAALLPHPRLAPQAWMTPCTSTTWCTRRSPSWTSSWPTPASLPRTRPWRPSPSWVSPSSTPTYVPPATPHHAMPRRAACADRSLIVRVCVTVAGPLCLSRLSRRSCCGRQLVVTAASSSTSSRICC